MSPEPEEEEVEGNGRVVFGKYFQSANDDLRDKTPSGTIQVLPTSNQATSPLSDPSQTDNINYVVHDSERGDAAEAVVVDKTDVDPLDKFLPPPPKAKCSEELQRKINKFLEYKKARKSFNAEVRNRKDYRNPDFLLHAVRYQDINQIGSCFSKDVFNPHGYDNRDYCDEIEADMRREMHRKEQEKKRNQKVDFVSLGTQPGMVSTAPKINIPHPGVSTTAASMLNSISLTADAITRNGRSNKKSKWDKDSVSAVGTHATVISASNAAGGYLAFVTIDPQKMAKTNNQRLESMEEVIGNMQGEQDKLGKEVGGLRDEIHTLAQHLNQGYEQMFKWQEENQRQTTSGKAKEVLISTPITMAQSGSTHHTSKSSGGTNPRHDYRF